MKKITKKDVDIVLKELGRFCEIERLINKGLFDKSRKQGLENLDKARVAYATIKKW